MFRLKLLELSGFRCFRDRYSIDLNYDVVVFVGPVGTGKTSILSAIQYALYGTTYEVKEHVAKLEDLINDYSDELYVKLVLQDEEGKELVVERRRRRGKRPTSHLTYATLIVEGESEVTLNVTKLLNIDVEDFMRHVYVSHRVLEDLIYGTPARRSLAIDKVFGVEELENLFRQFPISIVEKKIQEFKERVRDYDTLIKVVSKYGGYEGLLKRLNELKLRISELEKLRSSLENEVASLKREVAELRRRESEYRKLMSELLHIKAQYESLSEKLDKLAKEIAEEPSPLILAEEVKALLENIVVKLDELLMHRESSELAQLEVTPTNIRDVVDTIENVIKKLEEKRYELSEDLLSISKELATYRGELERLRVELASLQRQLASLEKIKGEYGELVKKYGTSEEVSSKVLELERQISYMSSEERFMESLLEVLKKVLADLMRSTKVSCPICDRELSRDMSNSIEKKISEVARKLEEAKSKAPELTKLVEEYRLVLPKLRSMEEALTRVAEIEAQISTIRRRMDELYEKVSNLESSRESLKRKMNIIAEFIKTLRARMEYIEKALEYIELREKVKQYEAKMDEVSRKLRELEFSPSKLEERLNRLLERSKRLTEVNEELSRVSKEVLELEDIAKRISTLEDREVLTKISRLEELRKKLLEVKQLYREVQAKVRARLIRSIGEVVSKFFTSTYRYGDITGVDMEVEHVSGLEYVRSIYHFYGLRPDGSKVPLLSKLSEGQRMLLMFSFILATSQLMKSNVGFILLDDPTPNIDLDLRFELLKQLLKTASETGAQIVLATQDVRVREVLPEVAKSLNLSYCIYSLEKKGLEVTVSVTARSKA
ncbi:MAG: hypothetical protein DRJ40_07595 [Thermoprotei archaeon]|nr:MAG: hypothetical protein DRJ40_07595 [Thermoprotei archaeon]